MSSVKKYYTRRRCSFFIAFSIVVILLTACVDNSQETRVPLKKEELTQLQKPDTQLVQARSTATRKLRQFQSVLTLAQQHGVDITPYQGLFNAHQSGLNAAHSVDELTTVTAQVDSDMSASLPLAKELAGYLFQQFQQAVSDWGGDHQYQDSYDGKRYPLDYEYAVLPDDYGAGASFKDALLAARTLSDYQSVITLATDDQLLLQALEDDAQDTTAWDQLHVTDQQVMQHFHVAQGSVIVVSLYEQTLRFYQNSQLQKAFQVVSGLYERPTPPGLSQIRSHVAQSWFTSFEPASSPFYFPPTLVHWALGFDDPGLGYFIHASPWRTYYGQGKNFPHDDPHNDNTESRNGSHGCINLSSLDAAWLYAHVENGTSLLIY